MIRLRFVPVGFCITILSINSFMISTVSSGSSVYLEILAINLEILSGFQNDNLVLTFTTDSNDILTFEYSAFHLTDTAKALIEILDIETDDEFFRELANSYREKLSESSVKISVVNVEVLS